MRLRELVPWPPILSDSRSHHDVLDDPEPARLRRCAIYSTATTLETYLSIVVQHRGRDWHAMIQGIPEALMLRIEATLAGQEGRTLAELGDVDVVDRVEPSTSPFAYKPRPEPPPRRG